MTLWRKWLGLTWRQRALLLAAVPAVVLASVGIRICSFNRLMKWIGVTRVAKDRDASVQARLASEVGRAVSAVAARAPWKVECLVQAVAAALLARCWRLPVRLALGVRRDETGELQAHAWVTCAGQVITGAAGRDRYQVVATF